MFRNLVVVVILLVLGDWTTNDSKTRLQALRLDLGLPGGGRLSYRDGLLRIQSSETKTSAFEIPWDNSNPEIAIENKQTPERGFGAFFCGKDPLPEGSFLGLYEGTLIRSRESLDALHTSRKKELLKAGFENDASKVSDYVLSLDGGLHFLDGFDLRYQKGQDMAFTPAHLNHSPKDDSGCNVLRKLVYLPDNITIEEDYPRNLPRVAFFASREIAIGEELAFDYGTNFWKKNN